MAEARFSQDEFLCSVCLDLLKDPVTIICGHSYCRSCITDCWNLEDQKKIYSCPQCRETFSPRPALAKNTILTEMVEKLKIKPSSDCDAGAGDVPCDVCTGRKYKAVKSCLECQESYCHTHLERHEEFLSPKRHRVIEATDGLQEMICSTHQKLLEYFCRTDQQCVCVLCVMDEHKDHDTVSAAAQRKETQKQLMETQREFQQKIQQQEKDLQQLRDSVESHKRSALQAVEDTEKIFTEMIQSIQRRRDEVKQQIRDQEKTSVSEAEGIMEKLQQEINDLKRKEGEIEKLLQTQDHISFIQSFPSLSASPESADVLFTSFSSFDDVTQSVNELKNQLDDFCNNKMKKINNRATVDNIDLWSQRNFLRYSRQFTLDLNTMNYRLRLSERNTVTHTDTVQSYPDHPDRFHYHYPQVLCEESVSGRCYWELEWTGDTGVSISVSYKSISRKGESHECVFGFNNQSWSLFCSSSGFSFKHNNIWTFHPAFRSISSISISRRVGVFVDHEAGTLSFYSVSDTMTLIHRVQTTFTQPLCPGVYVGRGSSVKVCDMSE